MGAGDRAGARTPWAVFPTARIARPHIPRPGIAEIAVGLILLIGVGLRVWMMHQWRPALLGYPDSSGYLYAAFTKPTGGLFGNQYRPAGYPLVLTWLHAIHSGLAFVIEFQHLMGLVCAVLLFLTVARFVNHRIVAVLPAAIVALSGTELYLEHAVLTETFYTTLTVLGLYCAARSYDSRGIRELLWLALAGAGVGASGPVRSVGIVLIVVLVGWAAATRRGWRRRAGTAVIVAIGFFLPFGGYLLYQHPSTDNWSLTRTTGETLYARTAVFADCRDFTPPAGLRALCPAPSATRLSANGYMFGGDSPLVQAFGTAPQPGGGRYQWASLDSKLQTFAERAILHQPGQYIWTTLQGLAKYVDPNAGTPNMLEFTSDELISTLQIPPPSYGQATVESYYPGHPTVHHGLGALNSYADAAKVEGPVTAVLLALMTAGWILARGRRRTAAGLLGWATVVMMVAPVAFLFYGARYATPAYGPLGAGAAIGLDTLLDTRWARRIFTWIRPRLPGPRLSLKSVGEAPAIDGA